MSHSISTDENHRNLKNHDTHENHENAPVAPTQDGAAPPLDAEAGVHRPRRVFRARRWFGLAAGVGALVCVASGISGVSGGGELTGSSFPGWLPPTSAAWSASRAPAALTYYVDPEIGSWAEQVDVVSVGGEATRLSLPRRAAPLALPGPDGQRVAFGTPTEIVVRDRSGDVRLPVRHRGEWIARPLAWAPDGSGVYYVPGRLYDQRWASHIPFTAEPDGAPVPISFLSLDGTERTLAWAESVASLSPGPGRDEFTTWGADGVRTYDAGSGRLRRRVTDDYQIGAMPLGASPETVITRSTQRTPHQQQVGNEPPVGGLEIRNLDGSLRHRVPIEEDQFFEGIGFTEDGEYVGELRTGDERSLVVIDTRTGTSRVVSRWRATDITGALTAGGPATLSRLLSEVRRP